MTVDQARKHYGIVLSALKLERKKRDKFLREPRRTQALAEIDEAIESLKQLGEVMGAAAKAGVLAGGHEQVEMFDSKPVQYP